MSDKTSVSARQLARTVGSHTSISVMLPNGDWLEGKLAGMDAYTYLVVDTHRRMHVVHKSAPVVRINENMTKDEVDATLAAFEKHLQDQHIIPATKDD